MKRGVVYITVKVRFETDLTEDEIRKVSEELDYNFKHKLISDTEIVEVGDFD